jgi:GTPase SAR1 family protein
VVKVREKFHTHCYTHYTFQIILIHLSERFREALIGGYLRKTDGIIFCFDVTNLESLASLHVWNEFTLLHAPEHAIKIMVGNKLDLWDTNKRAVEPAYIAVIIQSSNLM